MARPIKFGPLTKVKANPEGKSKLQATSARAAVLGIINSNGGELTLADIDAKLTASGAAFSCKQAVGNLVRFGWLTVTEVAPAAEAPAAA
jgi:hypothetical protein